VCFNWAGTPEKKKGRIRPLDPGLEEGKGGKGGENWRGRKITRLPHSLQSYRDPVRKKKKKRKHEKLLDQREKKKRGKGGETPLWSAHPSL